MAIDPILARHGRILAVVEKIEALVLGDRPARVDTLADRRWAFTHELMVHCVEMHALFAALMTDRRPQAVSRAELANQRTQRFVARFQEHIGRWQGLPSAENWDDYRAAVAQMIDMIRHLIDTEAREIVPLLPVRASGVAAPALPQNYVEGAWQVRRMLFDSNERPVE